MIKRILPILILPGCLFLTEYVSAQIRINGPTCVIPEQEYQYTVSGSLRKGDEMNLCVIGGKIAGYTNNCISAEALGLIKISWDDNISSGKLEIRSSSGNSVLNISMTTVLNPGKIDSEKTQNISYNEMPVTITCESASGGSCSSNFQYQWQRSANALKWEDIPGAVKKNLIPNTKLTETTYMRRKVTLATNGSVGYSDLVTLIVNPLLQ
ncbi:MAG TPA: hypothetical protein VJU78_16080 [Chitinophagaceae bacterium]|nr:hypothetical protein [Chitinophagaceae bacterium]